MIDSPEPPEVFTMPGQRREALIGRRRLALSNLGKPLFPGGFTKGRVIDYYLRVAPAILPHLRDRPVTFKRYPHGIDGPFFFEKNCSAHRPDWVKTALVSYGEDHRNIEHCILKTRADLVWAANLAAVELHTSLARRQRIERPTMVVFDLDPGPGADILDCRRVALQLHEALGALSLRCLTKTSGGKGLHLYIPLNTPAAYGDTQAFARALATLAARQDPRRVTAVMAKAQRRGKVYVDWAQNMLHKTTVCAYSLRARSGPTVSTPVGLEELERARSPRDLAFGPDEVLDRMSRLGDLFKPVLSLRQRLPDIEALGEGSPEASRGSFNPRRVRA